MPTVMDPEYQKLLSTPRRVKIIQDHSPALRNFIAEHQLSEPRPVPCRPLPFCRQQRCFVNVDQQVLEAGGSAMAGWMFLEVERISLQTEAHCIWVNPQGEWIDITPQASCPRRVLFSPDPRVAEKRGYTVGHETPLTNNQKVIALQKFTCTIARLREAHLQGFGQQMLIPAHLFGEAAQSAGLPEDVAIFLIQKLFGWDQEVAEKYRH